MNMAPVGGERGEWARSGVVDMLCARPCEREVWWVGKEVAERRARGGVVFGGVCGGVMAA